MKLQDFRLETGLNQTEVAERMATSQAQVSSMEVKNSCSLSSLRRYFEALGFEFVIHAVGEGGEVVDLSFFAE